MKLVDFSFDEVDTGTGTGTQEELYTNLSGVETEGLNKKSEASLKMNQTLVHAENLLSPTESDRDTFGNSLRA